MEHKNQPNYQERALRLYSKVKQYMTDFGESIEHPESFLSKWPTQHQPTTTVLIGQFTNEEQLGSWGRALGEALEVLISDLTALGIDNHLNQPDPHPNNRDYCVWGLEGYASRTELKTLKKIAELSSTEHGLTAHLTKHGDQHQLELSWHDLLSGTVKDSQVLQESGDSPQAELLVQSALWVLSKTGHQLSTNTGHILRTHCPQSQMDMYHNILQKLGDRDWDYLPKTRLSGFEEARLPVLALFLMNLESDPYISPGQAYARYKLIEQRWHNHIWLLSLQSSIYQNEADDFEVDREGCQQMLKSYNEKPHITQAIPRLANLLLECEQNRRALGLSFALLMERPDTFISWWTVMHALSDTAWEYRGNDWAHNVSETYADAFADLSDYAVEAAENALQLSPKNPKLLTERLELEQGATQALWDWLLDVVELDPGYQAGYEAALNFTQPRWGGWVEYQMAIIKLAHEHNPKAAWVIRLYFDYIERNSTDYDLLTRIRLMGKRLFSKDWPASFPTDDED